MAANRLASPSEQEAQRVQNLPNNHPVFLVCSQIPRLGALADPQADCREGSLNPEPRSPGACPGCCAHILSMTTTLWARPLPWTPRGISARTHLAPTHDRATPTSWVCYSRPRGLVGGSTVSDARQQRNPQGQDRRKEQDHAKNTSSSRSLLRVEGGSPCFSGGTRGAGRTACPLQLVPSLMGTCFPPVCPGDFNVGVGAVQLLPHDPRLFPAFS